MVMKFESTRKAYLCNEGSIPGKVEVASDLGLHSDFPRCSAKFLHHEQLTIQP